MIYDFLEKQRPLIDEKILSILKGSPVNLYEASRHLVKAGGKRHRPVMALFSSKAVGGSFEDALNASAAVELVHTFSLVQDDIFDNDELRRGAPSVHVKWGEDTAILASDLLFSKAFETITQSPVNFSKISKGVKRLAISCNRITEGQTMDISQPSSEKDYMELIKRKTAELHGLACHLGALFGGGSQKQINSLEKFGEKTGLAFQLRDDIIDIKGSEEQTGKPKGSDLMEGKNTLVVLHAYQEGDKETVKLLDKIFKTRDKGLVDKLVEKLSKGGHIEYVNQKAEKNLKEGKICLKNLPETEAKQKLLELANFMVQREK